MPVNSQPKWSAIKAKLTALQPPELIELLKGLCEQSADNRLFLATKLFPEDVGAEALEPYRKRIVVQFFRHAASGN